MYVADWNDDPYGLYAAARCPHGEDRGDCDDCAYEAGTLLEDEPAWWHDVQTAHLPALHPELAWVYQRLQGLKCIIAGGAALDATRAEDIDVFFYTRWAWEDGISRFVNAAPVWDYAGLSVWATPRTPDHRIIHGVVGAESTLKAVLARFDTSTHQCALLRDGTFVPGPSWTPPTVAPQVLRTTTPVSTLDRYRRICKRYGHAEDAATVMRLEFLADAAQPEAA
jgi:hypothetical protein